MVDANLLIREYLLGQSEVTALLGTNQNGSIYCGYDLPEGFDPTLGPAIQIYRVGGRPHSEITQLIDARMMVRAWAGVEQALIASGVAGAIMDVLHGLCGYTVVDGTIIRSQCVLGPLEMTDPKTGWIAVYAFYQVMARPNGSTPPSAYVPQFYEGSGAPVTLHNNDDIYYETSNGNLYEQVASVWVQIGNIAPSGDNLTRYDNVDVGGLTATGNPAVWTLSVAFAANALVFRNGGLLSPGAGADYTTSGTSITFAVAPASSDNLVVMQ